MVKPQFLTDNSNLCPSSLSKTVATKDKWNRYGFENFQKEYGYAKKTQINDVNENVIQIIENGNKSGG